jgi:hypothetical protein
MDTIRRMGTGSSGMDIDTDTLVDSNVQSIQG